MISNQSALIQYLREFLINLSKQQYSLCRKTIELLNKSSKKQWGSLALQCTKKIDSCQKQYKKLKEENKRFLQTIKNKHSKSSQVEKLKNGKVLKQELNEVNKLNVFLSLQTGLYWQAFRQSNISYDFLQHLIEYSCLLKIWQNSTDDIEIEIEEPQLKSEFYWHTKSLLVDINKKEQQFESYAQKISKGERLQPYEYPRFLSKRIYQSLLELQQKLKRPIQYCEEDFDHSEHIGKPIKVLKKIYRQFFQRQFNPHTFETISLQQLLQILRNDLNSWKKKINQQKYQNKGENILQKIATIESLRLRNQDLENKAKLFNQSLMKIVNSQICKEIQAFYPENENDSQDIINCLAENTQKMRISLEKVTKQHSDLQKQIKSLYQMRKHEEIYSQTLNSQQPKSVQNEQQKSQQEYNITILEQQLEKYSNENESYKKQIYNLSKKIQKFQKEIQEKHTEFKKLMLELSDSQKRIQNFQSKLKKQTGLIKQKQLKEYELLQSIMEFNQQKKRSLQSSLQQQPAKYVEPNNDCQIQNLKAIIQDLKKRLSEEIQKHQQLQKSSKLKEERLIESHKKQMQRQKQRYDKLLSEYNQLQQQLNAHQRRIQQTHEINNQLQAQFNQIKHRSQILQDPLQEQDKSVKNEIDIRQQKIQQYQKQNSILKQKYVLLQNKYTQIVNQEQANFQKFKQSQQKIWEKIKIDLDLQRQNHKITKQQLKNKNAQLVRLHQQNKIYHEKSQSLTKQISLFKTAEQANLRQSSLKNSHLFNSKGIFDDLQQRQHEYLVKTLESYCGKISKAKLLYFYDPLNKTNFHRYVDNHKNLLVIVKTLYGKLLAGFSQVQINPTGIKLGFGLLMSLWKQCSFEILPGKKPVTYDDYYIIFGNSEIRLRSQQDKIFSNFGISNGFYKAGPSKVEDLLGQREREIDITGYEFYEVQFSS